MLAFAQGHRSTYTDTRVELTAAPGIFLHRVASVWSPTVDLGHIQSGQYVGYLFPMGPWFAGFDALGIPLWIAERLWLGLVLWVAGYGVVRLLDALYDRRRSAVHLVGAVIYLANPYVVVQANRATASLLAYAALPWLLLAAHRGLRAPRAWLWPAVVALVIAASSGGTNAATVFWIALAPAALLLYEILVTGERLGDALSFAWRSALLAVLASLWWIVPAMVAGGQGPDFLSFTEQPSAIWSTTSLAESFRLMGYWLSYFDTGFGGVVQASSTAVRPYLENQVVIAASFAIPLLAFGGLVVTRRWRYAPFFGLLAVGALLVMSAGYPAGKPAAGTFEAVYYHLKSTQFLRTTYKAGPLLALSMACLAGAAAGQLPALLDRVGSRGRELRWAAWAVLAVAAVLFAYPLARGHLIEPDFVYGSVPGEWRAATADAATATPSGRRIMVLPGQLFGAYRWGQTVDPPIAPVLTRHPVLQRTVGHYADPRAAQLQETVDDLIQQGRLVPGQLAPLLDLMGVGHVLVAADGRVSQSGESPPATIAESLSGQSGFERPAAVYGPTRSYPPLRGQGGPSVALPDLRRYATPGARAAGPVRVNPVDGSLLLDGDSEGLAQLAGTGALTPRRALFYAGDLGPADIRGMVRTGAELVFSDSNRRRRLTPAVIRGDVGPTLAADDAIPRDAPAFDLFPARGTAAQTVADYGDLAHLRAPAPGRNTLSRERQPFAAFDGRLDTAWQPPEPLGDCPCLSLELRHPHAVPYIRIHPRALDSSAPVPIGVSVNGGLERVVELSPLGWNRVGVGPGVVRSLRLRIIERPLLGAYSLDEVQIPGVRARESLRLPTWLATATRGLDLARNSILVELQRTSGDFPFRPATGDDQTVDAEADIARLVTLPVRRGFAVAGWATPSPGAPDSAFDRLAGVPAGWRMDGSSRFEGMPGRRASSAFDGDAASAWVADFDSRRQAWLSIHTPRPVAVRDIRLRPGPAQYASPAEVEVEAGGRTFSGLAVRDGVVRLPDAVRTSSLRLDVTEVDAPTSSPGRRLDAVAVGEVEIPGLRSPAPRRTGSFTTPCGAVRVRSALGAGAARVSGDLTALDRGGPLRLDGCALGATLELPRGTSAVTATGTTMRPYLISLRSPGQDASPPAPAGTVDSQGHGSDDSRTGVRLSLQRPAWLVLDQSYAKGWRATCRSADGAKRNLGDPTPIDGFANGWRVKSSCARAEFRFAPQRMATISYIVSALAGLALLVIFALAALARRRRGTEAPDDAPALDAAPEWVFRLAPPWALAFGVAVGLVGGWFFALRAGVLLAVAAAILAWVGITARRLLWLVIPALALIPLLYVLDPASGSQGFFHFADDHQAAHWLGVAAVCALGGGCLLDAWGRRRAGARADT